MNYTTEPPYGRYVAMKEILKRYVHTHYCYCNNDFPVIVIFLEKYKYTS